MSIKNDIVSKDLELIYLEQRGIYMKLGGTPLHRNHPLKRTEVPPKYRRYQIAPKNFET